MQHTILPSPTQEYPAKNSPDRRSRARSVLPARTCCLAPEGVFAVRLFKDSFWLFAIACILAISLSGQETTGTISGVVYGSQRRFTG